MDRQTEKALPSYREIIRLHDELHLSFNEIARMWRLTPQRIQAKYKRATEVLRDAQ